MANQRQNTNPWGDAMGQAVGAMYKYYMSQPSKYDMMRAQLTEAQLQQMPYQTEKLQLDNKLNQRLYDQGGYANAPAAVLIQEYMNRMPEDQRQGFINMQHPGIQVDTGDTKRIVSPVNAAEIYATTVGTAPQWKELNGQYVPTKVIPSQLITGQRNAPTVGTVTDPRKSSDMIETSENPPVYEEDFNTPNKRGKVALPSMYPNDESVGQPSPGIRVDGPAPSDINGSSIITAPMNPLDRAKRDEGRAKVTALLNEMANAYSSLEQHGGAITPENTGWENLQSSVGASSLGRMFGQFLGTDTEADRRNIENMKQAAMLGLKPAADLAAQQMNTKPELDQLLAMYGDPEQRVDVVRDAIKRVEDQYGLGAANFSDPNRVDMLTREKERVMTPPQTGNITIQTDEEYDRLPRGVEFIGPDGVRRRKQ